VRYLHLAIAVGTLLLWIVTVTGAWRPFPRPPAPNAYAPRHRLLGRCAALGLGLTAVTGWAFSILAFVC